MPTEADTCRKFVVPKLQAAGVLPGALQVPPISDRGNVIEIAKFFGATEKLREAVNQLQTLLYLA